MNIILILGWAVVAYLAYILACIINGVFTDFIGWVFPRLTSREHESMSDGILVGVVLIALIMRT